MIDLQTAQAFFWLCFGTGLFIVLVLLGWVLFEVARLVRQGNDVLLHVRDIVAEIEEDIANLKEKFGTVIGNVAGMAKGASKISGLMDEFRTEGKKKTRSKS
ncbi:MAG: hypothetical protein P1P90_05135 [Patescibacteria group bacterium]|nr:hypothetical protein [Patescibacteria group bacterium]